MITEDAPSSATEALQLLAALPALTTVDMNFTAIGPDDDGTLSGFRINLKPEAKSDIADVAEHTRTRLTDAALLAYGPATLIPAQHWMYISETSAATLTTIEEVVHTQDLLPFDETAAETANLKMVAARFVIPEQPTVTFYRVADPLLQLQKSRILSFVREGGSYRRLEPANVLLLRPEFDVVVIGGFAFFTKKATFERAFGFFEELKQESLATFMAVTRELQIDGMDELRKACTSQPQMMAKMASIKRSMDADPAYAAAMTMPKLIAYIETHPHVHIDVVGSGPETRLVFDPKPTRRFQIVKLLDDDFLRSVLTEREYEAGSKVQAE